MTSADPPTAATEMPPPMAVASQMTSGVTPVSPAAPSGPAVSPVLTPSKPSRAPLLCSRSFRPAGDGTPMGRPAGPMPSSSGQTDTWTES